MDSKIKKSPFKVVWIVSTIIFCALFVFALSPGAAAQANPSPVIANAQTQIRNFTNSILQVYDFILRSYVDEVDSRELFEGAMNGMFGALNDPYSSFLSESDLSDLGDTTQGRFGGVGLNITKGVTPRADGRPLWVEVVSPIEGTPGWRAGINPGDFITEIDGVATETLTMDEVLSRLRGTPGESVRLVIRRGERMEFPLTIVRAEIEVPTVRHAMIGNTGYLKLLTFTPMTVGRAREAIDYFRTNNYDSVILDLRNNYGGRLDAAVEIANLFLDGGLVVRIRSRIRSENRDFNANRVTPVPANMPVIVLINRGSASASEIVAGALKDRGRAYLVGENSFGKGSVQQVFPLNGAGFKLTTARYFTPNDVSIDRVGIPPDLEVRFPEFTEEDAERMNQLLNANRIPEFVRANPQATAAQINTFAQTLNREYHLDLPLLRRLIRNEINRTVIAPVYDLEYDIQLQEAVNILRSGNYDNLLQNARTLRVMQDETEIDLPQAS
jgi:carboxyl-terminal processing protease